MGEGLHEQKPEQQINIYIYTSRVGQSSVSTVWGTLCSTPYVDTPHAETQWGKPSSLQMTKSDAP